MATKLSIGLGEAKKDVVITTVAALPAGVSVAVTLDDGLDKNDGARMVREIRDRINEETNPPTNTP